MSTPHGGRLINRILEGGERERVLEEVKELPRLKISKEIGKDVENIAKGVFSPLEGFLLREDFYSVVEKMRLADDTPWTIPIILDASPEDLGALGEGDQVLLTVDGEKPLALLEVEEIYDYDKGELAEKVFKTTDQRHPEAARILQMKDLLVGGRISLIEALESPFPTYSLSPKETRVLFKAKGWKTIAGFQTRNTPHLGHEYVQKAALTLVDGIFINPIIGRKKRGDFKDEVIIQAYKALIDNYYLKDKAVLAILETEMRYAGPREAIFHAIIRKNFGCTHFIVGRDHAGLKGFYKPYEAQEIFKEFPDLGIEPIFFRSFFYCKRCGGVENEKTCPHGEEDHITFSGTKIRRELIQGRRPSKYLMRPEVAEIILGYENPFIE